MIPRIMLSESMPSDKALGLTSVLLKVAHPETALKGPCMSFSNPPAEPEDYPKANQNLFPGLQ
jgi:hypothetical protein